MADVLKGELPARVVVLKAGAEIDQRELALRKTIHAITDGGGLEAPPTIEDAGVLRELEEMFDR